ncbi:hypothetical protein Hypma_010429 [Hypsizygus marmoreus]|uniref:Uncharacterized protein n=1 Tax=Hypsizygus marmoreus TaxID=39966 RepID=A0A369KBG0_HYPMA|nr:hypothetical protein Hypma_010429 [Hypsizygus marmoreus]
MTQPTQPTQLTQLTQSEIRNAEIRVAEILAQWGYTADTDNRTENDDGRNRDDFMVNGVLMTREAGETDLAFMTRIEACFRQAEEDGSDNDVPELAEITDSDSESAGEDAHPSHSSFAAVANLRRCLTTASSNPSHIVPRGESGYPFAWGGRSQAEDVTPVLSGQHRRTEEYRSELTQQQMERITAFRQESRDDTTEESEDDTAEER